MTLLTPCLGFPYPQDTDPIDVAGDMAALALAVDTALCNNTGKSVGEVFTFLDTGNSPYPDGSLLLDGSTFSAATYPLLNTHLGGNQLPDFRGRFLRMADASFPAGTTGGFNNAVVVEHDHIGGAHQHSINHDHVAFTSGNNNQSHSHSINHDHPNATSGTGGSHNHGQIDNLGNIVFGSGINFSSGSSSFGIDTWANHDGHQHAGTW